MKSVILFFIPILFIGCSEYYGEWVDSECKNGVVINYWYRYNMNEEPSSKNTDKMILLNSWVATDKNTDQILKCGEKK